ncbi:MAG TPA: hypothetical protein DEH15_18445 [Marinilabiliales bacterium]|nr:hypothetical protein [Marinilabiliales bacterium]HBY54407.1 hypothetical protein [Marinilabiliales bacterium]
MKKAAFVPFLLCIALILGLFFTQCKPKKRIETVVDPGFSSYVKAFPPKVISNQAQLVFELFEEVPNIEPGQEASTKLFDFSPSIKGVAYWKDNHTLVFDPEERLPSDKLYEAKFHLGKIIQVPDELQTLKIEFRTRKLNISVEASGLKVYQNDDLTRQKLSGKLFVSDGADAEKVEKILSAVQNGKELTISWDHLSDGVNHHFTVENVIRGTEKSDVILQWDGAAIGSIDKGEEVIEIPALGDFKVFDIRVVQQPEQCITVYFSDPLDTKQELLGLVYLRNKAETRFVIKEGEIKIYPVTRQSVPTELVIEQGVKNIMGFEMKERFTSKIEFSNIKPDIQLIGNGVILPNSQGMVFPFRTVNIHSVNVKIIKIFENNISQFLQSNQFDGAYEMRRVGRIIYKKEVPLTSEKNIDFGVWNNFSLDLSKLIETEPGAIYRVHLSFTKKQSLYPCVGEDTPEDESEMAPFDEDPELAQFDEPGYYYYDDDYYDYDYDYNYQERDDPCKNSYYRSHNCSVARNVLASDLGIIAKAGSNQEYIAIITDLRTTEPLAGVEVEFYNFQNQLMDKGTTDSEGKLVIPLPSKPFLLVAKKDKQRGYLRLDDGSALSVSMFDVTGQETKKGIKGFIYGERGVWRPGDSIYLTFLLEDKNKVLPANHPVVMEFYNPENQLFERKVKTAQLNNFFDFRTATKTESPTGNWLVKIKVGGSVFTKYLKIETVKPNRLKISIAFGKDLLTKSENTQGTLELKWLHGAIAKNLKADIALTLSETVTSFKGFEGYQFDDPSKNFDSEEQSIFSGLVNENGKATISTKLNVANNAPGMLNAKFKTRAFEEGGDFSIDLMQLKYSPYSSYVGLKIPEGKGWNNALYSNEPNLIPIVTLDEKGTPVDRKNLKIEIFQIYWRWWWEYSDDEDLGRYLSNESQNLMKTDYIDTKAGKAMYEMNLNQESWGRKLIRITDPVSGHSTGQLFYTTYKGWWNSNDTDNPGGAEMLTFSTDKKTYAVGEQVTVNLPIAEEGRVFVSLESGSKILKTFWVEMNKNNAEFRFEATPDMAPNVYVHVSFIQPHLHTTNDLPIRMYGIQSVGIEDPETHLQPEITMPNVLEPEKEVTIQIKEKQGKPMTYTIAVVDEGLLDLTRFSTPNAWQNFYAREALGVKTWDLYKYVMGAFTGEMAGLLALGGDEDLQKKASQKANRFKPVVTFLGPFELTSGTNSHTFLMPNYVGSVKTMVVAGFEGAYGSAEKTTPVKKPLMTLATLPRVLGPGEKVQLPVTVFAMDAKIKEVAVTVETNEFFKIAGESKQTISFNQEGDQVVYFNLEVTERIGVGKVTVTAQGGKDKATYPIELDVRIPNPQINEVFEAIIEPGKEWNSPYKAVGVLGTNKGTLELSSMPPINLAKRIEYLIQYPHGCVEQTTSSVFPQLYLKSLMDLMPAQNEIIEKNIKAAIEKLRTFQLTNGGLSYWPGESGSASDWGTSYAGHFLIEAQNAGYQLPVGFLKSWIDFQTERANDWSIHPNGSSRHYVPDQLLQAYRLYTLALVGKPALGAMNRLKEYKGLSNAATWRLAAAYLLAGRESVALDLILSKDYRVDPYKEFSGTYGSDVRDKAMILETLVLLKNFDMAKELVEELSKQLSSSNWYSTQTTAYSLMALAKFANGVGSDDIKYELTIDQSKKATVTTQKAFSQHELLVDKTPEGMLKVKNNSKKMLFAKIQMSGIPLTGDASSASNDLVLKIRYLDLKNNPIDPSQLVQGTDFIAEARIEHPGIRGEYKEMALTQIFPSGWEIRNLRFEETTSSFVKDIPRYLDIRDDRVYSYFDVGISGSRTFRVLLNAAYVGTFYLPTVYCEAMYDNDINGRVGGKWVEVVKQ